MIKIVFFVRKTTTKKKKQPALNVTNIVAERKRNFFFNFICITISVKVMIGFVIGLYTENDRLGLSLIEMLPTKQKKKKKKKNHLNYESC